MSLKDVVPGKYVAKAKAVKFTRIGANETPAVVITFQFGQEHIDHAMFLTTTQCKDGLTVADHTFDVLAKIGYDETTVPAKLADKEVEIVIEHEVKEDNIYTKVRYVNELGGNRYVDMPVQQVLGNMNLKGQMAAARARMGVKTPAHKMHQSDVPF